MGTKEEKMEKVELGQVRKGRVKRMEIRTGSREERAGIRVTTFGFRYALHVD